MTQTLAGENEHASSSGTSEGKGACRSVFFFLLSFQTSNFDGWLWLRLSRSSGISKSCPHASPFTILIFVKPDVPLISGVPCGGMPTKSPCCQRNILHTSTNWLLWNVQKWHFNGTQNLNVSKVVLLKKISEFVWCSPKPLQCNPAELTYQK